MSDRILQKAEYEYRQFINELSAFKARHVTLAEPDPPAIPFVPVGQDEALAVFWAQNPQYRDYQVELLKEYYFDKEKWEEMKKDVASTQPR